jgi:hypothetical protein
MSDILKKIKTRGYWEVIIRPNIFVKDKIKAPAKCKEIVRDLKVTLRGWDYPHYDFQNPPQTGVNYIEQSFEWSFFLEFWRYYQSGQFIHYFGMMEDWQDQAEGGKIHLPYTPALSILSALYRITEIYLFASRLAVKGFLGDDCKLSITLHGTEGRKLVMLPPSRILFRDYISHIDSIPSEFVWSKDDLIGRPAELSLEHTVYFFHRFNWDNPPISVLKEDQTKLLEGRL